MCGRCGKILEGRRGNKGFLFAATTSTKPRGEQYLLENKGLHLWIKMQGAMHQHVFSFCGYEAIFSVAGTCKSLQSMFIKSSRADVFWARMCDAHMSNGQVIGSFLCEIFTSWNGDEDDLYMVMPGTESPQTWLEHFRLCHLKHRWLLHTVETGGRNFLQYLQTYKKVGSLEYGRARTFCRHHNQPIYLIVQTMNNSNETETIQHKYENIDAWQLQGEKKEEFITSSSTTIVQLFSILSEDEDEDIHMYVLTSTSSSIPASISYADVAEALSQLNVVNFEPVSVRKEMPWDAYFVTVKEEEGTTGSR